MVEDVVMEVLSANDTTIRLMRPADLPAVASIHLASFAGHRSALLGAGFVKAEYRWFLAHFPQLALVSEQDGMVVGSVIGATPAYGTEVLPSLWREALVALLLRPWLLVNPTIWAQFDLFFRVLVLKRLRRAPKPVSPKAPLAESVRPSSEDAPFFLASIAVDPTCRGRGIAGQLIQAFEQQARALGAARLRLTVLKNNLAAQRAYENTGWYKVATTDRTVKYRKDLSA